MKRVLGWLLMVGGGLLVLVGIAAIPLLAEVVGHARICGANDDSVEAALTPIDILDAAPAGAVPVGERDHSCTDPDDHHASISRAYRLPGQNGSRGQTESFYRDLALRNGWKLLSVEDAGGGPRCVVREADGAEVVLDVSFTSDTSYEVSASTWPC